MTAAILPNGRKIYFNPTTGAPLAGGSVAFYTPGTTTFKATWQDQAQTTANANPVTLDSAGTALIWGSGSYREYVEDSLGNLVSDSVTSAYGVSDSMAAVVGASSTSAALALLGGRLHHRERGVAEGCYVNHSAANAVHPNRIHVHG